ncbi:hypothetical protein [Streptomyces ehimensis]|uniref:Uncharacterized protein n=1 Tax=Streptomyces ehimensis TaxID=68195 RepID=A0ABV9BJQ8_9ACTN
MSHTPEQTSEASLGLKRGDLVLDTATGRVGEVMDNRWNRYQLRPLGGGREWHANPLNLVSPRMNGPRCPECWRIKSAYYAASHEGDREAAARWTTEMGLHQRAAHP